MSLDSSDFAVLQRAASALARLADLLETVIDKKTGTIRMRDVDRAKVYSEHLGKKLSQ
jgi:hypothetical protein